ncbi:MAG: flotillin-like FloA family protein [Pirellulaceae bacterium]|nr:flotillin-like FloA family protein [Pirellulaceae bacterium]
MNSQLAQLDFGVDITIGAVVIVLVLFAIVAGFALLLHFSLLWIPAYMASADVSFVSLVGMSLRRVPTHMLVTAKIMATQAGLNINRKTGISTERLEAHFLAGGDVKNVLQAIIAAHRAGIDLDFDRAAAINLAGRDVLDAVRTTVSPRVIDCPELEQTEKNVLSAVAKNGIELLIRVRVTIRTNLEQLIGGATEKTIVARVGHGIISAVGSSLSHLDVLATPDNISAAVHSRGLDVNTAFEIVSINIVSLEVGENVGARLQLAQAEADTRMALAEAEARRAAALAYHQEMIAELTLQNAHLILAEAKIPVALAVAFRAGQLHVKSDGPTLVKFDDHRGFNFRIAK